MTSLQPMRFRYEHHAIVIFYTHKFKDQRNLFFVLGSCFVMQYPVSFSSIAIIFG